MRMAMRRFTRLTAYSTPTMPIMDPENWTTVEVSAGRGNGSTGACCAMSMKRRQHRAQRKAMMALEAVQARRTVHEWAADDGVQPTPIRPWQRQWLEGMSALCSSRRQQRAHEGAVLPAERYPEIGRLKRERAWLKKKWPHAPMAPRAMSAWGHPELRVRRPGVWRGWRRASLDDVPAQERAEHVALMRVIDQPYTRTPCDGSRRMMADRHRQG
jgi:transposase